MERRLDLGKRVFQIPVLVGKGKRGADLFEARRVLPVSQEPIGFQGRRERKTARIETRGRCPGKKPCPGALIGREAVSRKVPAPRASSEIGRKPLNVTPLRVRLLYFPQARSHSTQLDLFCNNRSYCAQLMSCGARAGLAEVGKVKVSADKLWGAQTQRSLGKGYR